jgi:catechol 2,3-dioxygenase-like lactoylglutathione lyase family enzyme
LNPYVSVITLAVRDLDKAKQFYRDGLGWPIQQDHKEWVSFSLAGGSSTLGLKPWDALAADAGVAAEGGGFRGVTLAYLTRAEERVAALLAEAERAGGTIVRPAERHPWGTTSGYFADPEGYLWKVSSGSGPQPYAE